MDRQEFYEQAENRILAIYPQQSFHHNAYIVGGRAGLEALRDAIDAALENKDSGSMEIGVGLAFAHPSDQETFTTAVIYDIGLNMVEEDPRRVSADDMPCPYYSKKAADAYSEGSVNLAPNERYIMAVGVAHHVLNERLKAAEEATLETSAAVKKKDKK